MIIKVSANAFLDYKNNTYYLNSNGIMAKGWRQIDGNWYYFRDWGGMNKNTFFVHESNTYYVDSSGIMAIGWKRLDNKWYYFDQNGHMYKNKFFDYKNNTYYVDSSGIMAIAWKEVNSNWYYFNADGHMYKSTFFNYKNNTYYVDSSGIMAIAWREINSNWYYFSKDGYMYKNKFFNYKNNTYYVSATGVMATGWKRINEKWYYFRDWGGMGKNLLLNYNNQKYYLGSSGVMVTGWKKLSSGWYYFKPTNGIAVKGWVKIRYGNNYSGDSYWNYFDKTSNKFLTDSDQKGCEHGRSTIRDLKFKSTKPYTYYCFIGDNTIKSKVDNAASSWGSNYLTKKSSLNSNIIILFSDSMGGAERRGITYFYIKSGKYTTEYLADKLPGNYTTAKIYLNKKISNPAQSTITHELGHALGLSHRVSIKNSIMCYDPVSRVTSSTSATDKNTCAHVN